MGQRLLHWGPLTAIGITLIIGIATTYLHLLWWPPTTFAAFLHLSFFLFFNYLSLVNLVRSAFFGPGYVPNNWKPPRPEDEPRLQYCRSCGGFKVPRSHHCSKCGRCILKMDHHCRSLHLFLRIKLKIHFDFQTWINNCVGHRNHALFVRFLAASTAGCIHAVVIILCGLYRLLYRVRNIFFEIVSE
ncbi:unnamed protein product [Gongylonema pulchrum]|uniref:Palmitoyltransferase n=1 Tax=Gongylonema pulchrum TaxID=637853 RepID=A0A183D114_9BILA|nr:unnamed protein product [Gongylonema pulchrum]